MAKKKVVDYVRGMLQKGYDTSSIRAIMLRYGYSNNDFEDALREASTPTVRHEIHFSFATIFILMLIAASLLIFPYFYYNYYNDASNAQNKLLDLNLEPVKTNVEAGQEIIFIKQLSNLGSSKRYDVVIKQEIIEPKTNKAITQKSETRAIETFGSTQTQLLVPKDAAQGEYVLKATVEYDGKKAVATLPIRIISPQKKVNESPYPNPNPKLVCDDRDSCTNDSEENGICVSNPITPCCGNAKCEANEMQDCIPDCTNPVTSSTLQTTETLEEIKEVAKLDPVRALAGCNKIEVPDLKDTCISNIGDVQKSKNYCTLVKRPMIKDSCYSGIAKSVNDNSLCDEISTESRKDSCYMTFVLDNKDYSVCERIGNKNLRQSCEALKQLNGLNS